MFGALNTSTSALVANRVRMETVAANVANANSLTDENGQNNPFRRRIALLSQGDPATGSDRGVHVQEIVLDQSPFVREYAPNNPLADGDGYIKKPNINPIYEQVNALEIARSYEANIQAAEATKAMLQASLRLIA